MKRHIISLGTALLFASCNNSITSCSINSQSIELGVIHVNEIKDSCLVIKNTGQVPLKIFGKTCSCECTIFQESNNIIKRNDSVLIFFSVKAYPSDRGRKKDILCTFKVNTESVFLPVHIKYSVM